MGTRNSKPFVNKQIVADDGSCLAIDKDGYAYTTSCSGDANQVFNYFPSGQIRQNSKCLIVDGDTRINGQRIKLGDCRIIGDIPSFHIRTLFENNYINPLTLDQGWDVGRPYFGGTFSDKISIVNRLSNKCLAISRGNKAEVVIWDCNQITNKDKNWRIRNPNVSLATRVQNRGGITAIFSDIKNRLPSNNPPSNNPPSNNPPSNNPPSNNPPSNNPPVDNPPADNPPVVVNPPNTITPKPIIITDPDTPAVQPSDNMQILNMMTHEGITPNYDIQLTSMTPDEIDRVQQSGEQIIVGPRTKLSGDGWEITNTSFEFDLVVNQLPSLDNMSQQPLPGPVLTDLTIRQTSLTSGMVINDGVEIVPGQQLILRNLIIGPNTIWECTTVGAPESGLKFYNPTGMEFDYYFEDNTERIAGTPITGAPFQSGIIQIWKDCASPNASVTYPPGRYQNTGQIAKLIVYPMTKVIIDGIFFDNQSLQTKSWDFCSQIKNPSEVIVEFSSNYIGLGVSRVQPNASGEEKPMEPEVPQPPTDQPVSIQPVVENFASTQFNGYPLVMQGLGYLDSFSEANDNNYDFDGKLWDQRWSRYSDYNPYLENFSTRADLPKVALTRRDLPYDNNPVVIDRHWFPSPVVETTIPGRSTAYWTDPGLETLALREISCGKLPLTGFGLSANHSQTRYKYNYQCGSEKDYIPYNGNDPRGPTHKLSEEVLLADLTSLFDIGVNCNGRAILGMQAIVDEGKLLYVYRCGKKPLTNFEQYQTPKVLGRADNIKPLLDMYVQCPEGQALSAWALNGYYARESPHGDLNAYYYNYRCGVPMRPPHWDAQLAPSFQEGQSHWDAQLAPSFQEGAPHDEALLEGFGDGNSLNKEQWVRIIIIIIIIALMVMFRQK